MYSQSARQRNIRIHTYITYVFIHIHSCTANQQKGRVQPENRELGAAPKSVFTLFQDVITKRKFAQVNTRQWTANHQCLKCQSGLNNCKLGSWELASAQIVSDQVAQMPKHAKQQVWSLYLV